MMDGIENVKCNVTHTSGPCGRFASYVWTISFPTMSLEVHNMTFKVNTPSCLSLWIRLSNTMKHKELLITWKKGSGQLLQQPLSVLARNCAEQVNLSISDTGWLFTKAPLHQRKELILMRCLVSTMFSLFKNRLSWTGQDMDLPEEADWIDWLNQMVGWNITHSDLNNID